MAARDASTKGTESAGCDGDLIHVCDPEAAPMGGASEPPVLLDGDGDEVFRYIEAGEPDRKCEGCGDEAEGTYRGRAWCLYCFNDQNVAAPEPPAAPPKTCPGCREPVAAEGKSEYWHGQCLARANTGVGRCIVMAIDDDHQVRIKGGGWATAVEPAAPLARSTCRPVLGGETGEDACVAPTASAEPDPTDYEAAAVEALRDPVVRRAFEEHERARTEREERARCMATVTHTVRTIPPITSLLDEAEDEERRARERRSAAPTEPAWNRVRYAVDARPEPDHVIAALAAAARGSWIMDDADEGNTLRALVVKARQQWDDTRARLRSLEVGGRASQGQSPGGER